MDRLATYTLGPGWATFGLALPRGAATTGVQVGTLPTQTDIKTRWPDGTIKFCVVTVKILTAGAYAITAADPVSGLPPLVAWPQAVVTLTIGGVAYRAALPSTPTSDSMWLSGPLVRESRVVVVPTTSALVKATRYRKAAVVRAPRAEDPAMVFVYGPSAQALALGWGEQPLPPTQVSPAAKASPSARAVVDPAAHPSLQVVFDVRSYEGGGHRVDVTVQNVRDSRASVKVTYDVMITIDNVPVFSRSGLTQYCRTRWREVFPAQGFVAAAVVPDFTPAYKAGVLTPFLSTVTDQRRSIAGQAWDPLQFGEMNPIMMTPGGRPEIGPYPTWTAQYVVHRKADQLAYMLKCADRGGSWSSVLMKADGLGTIRLDERPNYYLSGAAPDGPSDGEITYQLDPTHAPSLFYVPYLVTGDRYYLDMQKGWANYFLIQTYTGPAYAFGADVGGLRSDRNLAIGSLFTHAIEPRGLGWPLRELVYWASIAPDTDPDQLYAQVCLKNNLTILEDYGNRPAQGFFNAPFEDFDPGNLHAGYASQSLWQSSFVAWALDLARQHGFGPGRSLVTRTVTCCIKLLTSAPDLPPEYGASVYYPRFGTFSGYVAGVPGTGTHVWFTSPAEFFQHNYNMPVGQGDSLDFYASSNARPLAPGYILGYYGADYRMLCQIGVRDGIPGAKAALAWLESYNNGGILGDVSWRSGWAVDLTGTLSVQNPPGPDQPVVVPPVVVPPVVTPSPPSPPTPSQPGLWEAEIWTSDQLDDNHADNKKTGAVTPVNPTPPPAKKAALSLEDPVFSETKPVRGGQMTTTWALRNAGPDESTGDTVMARVPRGFVFVRAAASQGTYAKETGLWTVGSVPSGGRETLELTVQVQP